MFTKAKSIMVDYISEVASRHRRILAAAPKVFDIKQCVQS